MVKNPPTSQETWVQDPLEEGMATHSSILAWRIPGTEELQSVGSQRIRHDRVTYTHGALAVCISNNNPVPFLFQ